jgi:hypothetical protein
MQQTSTFPVKAQIAPDRKAILNSTPRGRSMLRRALLAVRRSQAMASMLPSLLLTGAISLVASAVARILWIGFTPAFVGAWMEAWLTTWPIAFPVAYLIGRPLARLAAHISTPPSRRGSGN